MATSSHTSEGGARGARMLRTALGPAIADFLEDPGVVEVMLYPDSRLWIDRLHEGTQDTISRAGDEVVRRQLSIPPTLTIRPRLPSARHGCA